MIFAVQDHSKLQESNKLGSHKYMVFGIDNMSPHAMYQCFCITSMNGRRVTYELPVVVQGMVGYLVPSNIHSFTKNELEQGSFIGQIQDTRDIYLHDFLDLCHDMHKAVVCKYLKYDTYYKIIYRFDKYCKNFFKNYKNVPEYRYVKKEVCSVSRLNYKYEPIDEILEILSENSGTEEVAVTTVEVKKKAVIPEEVKTQVNRKKRKQQKVLSKQQFKKPENWDKLWEEYISWRICTKEFEKLAGLTHEEFVRLYNEEKNLGNIPEERQKPWFSKFNPYRDLYRKGYTRITDDVLDKETTPDTVEKNIGGEKVDASFKHQKEMKIIDSAPYRYGLWDKSVWDAAKILLENYTYDELAGKSERKKSAQTWGRIDEMIKKNAPGIKYIERVRGNEPEEFNTKEKEEKNNDTMDKMTDRDKHVLQSIERFSKKLNRWTENQCLVAYEILDRYNPEIIAANSKRWNSKSSVQALKGVISNKVSKIVKGTYL